jgi:DNA-binding NtrC family response regulator
MTNRNTILYAEDDRGFRQVYERVLKRNFPENPIETFSDGSSLERRLAENLDSTALVITDNDMPIVAGEKAAIVMGCGSKIIKNYARRNEFKQIPFVLLYAAEPIIGKVAVENGAFAYAGKLSEMNNVIATIKRALEYSGSQPTLSLQ